MRPSYLYNVNPIPGKTAFILMRPRQNGRHFTVDVFKCIFLNGNVWISLKISLKFVPKGPINNIPALIHIMAWRRPGDKPLCEPVMVSLLTHICVTRPQWVNIEAGWRIYASVNAFENIVCEMAAILSRPQYVKKGSRLPYVRSKSVLCSIFVIVVLYMISCYAGACYNAIPYVHYSVIWYDRDAGSSCTKQMK